MSIKLINKDNGEIIGKNEQFNYSFTFLLAMCALLQYKFQ